MKSHPSKMLPIGIDSFQFSAFTYGLIDISTPFLTRTSSDSWYFRFPQPLSEYGVYLSFRGNITTSFKVFLRFSASRLLDPRRIESAMPSDAFAICETLESLLAFAAEKLSFTNFPSVYSDQWRLSRMDLFVDFHCSPWVWKVLLDSLEASPLKWSSQHKVHSEDEDLCMGEFPSDLSGCTTTNRGKRRNLQQVAYDKQLECYKHRPEIAGQVPVGTFRLESRIFGAKQLKRVNLSNRTIPEALSFSGRTSFLRFVFDRRGLFSREKCNPLTVRDEYLKSLKWRSHYRYRLIMADVLGKRYEAASQTLSYHGEKELSASYMDNLRRKWRNMGLLRFDPHENWILSSFVRMIEQAPDGCWLDSSHCSSCFRPAKYLQNGEVEREMLKWNTP